MTDSANARMSDPASDHAFAAPVLVRSSRDEDVNAIVAYLHTLRPIAN